MVDRGRAPQASTGAYYTAGERDRAGMLARFALLLGLLLGLPLISSAARAADAPVHTFRVPVTPFALRVDPAGQAVPAGIPARVRAWVELPNPGAGYASAVQDYLRANYTVRATLYLPEPDPDTQQYTREVECPVGGEFRLDRLPASGRCWLREIRLVSLRDGRDFLFAKPDSVAIDIGGDFFVAWVSAEPMSWAEMNAAGVVFGEDSYENYHFVIGFELEGQLVEYEFPLVQTPAALPATPADWSGVDTGGGGCLISEVELDVSGISIPALPASTVRLPGLVLIPGGVGFLHQHFQVLLLLANALPASSGYALADLTAAADLPVPAQCQSGDPLCLVELQDGGNAPVQPVLGEGDATVLAPGESGRADWIVMGRKVGYHEFPIRIEGELRTASGDRSWPISGSARAGIAVREDPRFRLTFIHPDRVERGREYDVVVHVTNVSGTDAIGFRLAVDAAALTGVGWVGAQYPAPEPGEPVPPCGAETEYCKATLAAGETVLLRYTLRALRSGMVTATYGEADNAGLTVGARLIFGIGTDGLPMNADRLVLPPVVRRAWDGGSGGTFEETALHLLGLCHTLSTAGAAGLPESFRAVDRATPPALARVLTESALALAAGMPRAEAAALLLQDVTALARADAGFRHTLTLAPGAAFLALLAAETAGGGDALATRCGYAEDFALLESALTPAGTDPTLLVLPAMGGSLRWLARPDDGAELRLAPAASGLHSVTLWTPAAGGGYHRLQFTLSLTAGDVLSVPASVFRGGSRIVKITGASGATAEVAPVQEQDLPLAAFRLAGAVKLNPDLLHGADPYGRGVLAVLNRRGALSPSEAATACSVTDNAIIAASPLGSGRLLGLVVNRPVGKFTPVQLQVNQLRSADGALLPGGAAPLGIFDAASAFEEGSVVHGRVRYPAGPPVVNPTIELWGIVQSWRGRQDICLSRFQGGADGRFDLPFVWNSPSGMFLVAVDPSTGARRRVSLALAGDGQELHPEILMFGTGTVVGQVVNESLAPRSDVRMVTARSEGDGRALSAVLEGDGRFRADGVVVGSVAVEAVLADRRRICGSTWLGAPGEVAALLLVVGEAAVSGRVVETVDGELRGVAHARLELGFYESLVSRTGETDLDGYFTIAGVPAGSFRLRATHPTLPAVAMAEGIAPDDGVVASFSSGAQLTGSVQDESAAGVSYAAVELEKSDGYEQFHLKLQAGFDGGFVCPNLPPGHYRITAGRPGLTTTATVDAWLVSGPNHVTVTVQSATAFQGRVLRSDGQPAAQGAVKVGPVTASIQADGSFMGHVPPGGYRFQAQSGAESESGGVTVPVTGEWRIRLRGRRAVQGKVVAVMGNGPQPVQVPLTLHGLFRNGAGEFEYRESLASTLSAAADGTFEFRGVWDGPFAIAFAGNSFYQPARVCGTTAGSDVSGLTLELPRVASSGRITGTLYGRDGITPVRTGIPLALKGPDGRTRDAVTTAGGAFHFSPPLPAGTFVLEAQDLYSGDRARQELYFAATGDVDVPLAMLGRHTLRVHLFDSAGGPLSEAWLSVTRQGLPALSRRAETVWDTDFAGDPAGALWFEFDDLWSGDYSVTAAARVDGTVQSVSGGTTLTGDGTEIDLHLTLAPAVTLRGLVLDGPPDDGGRPVPGAEITLRAAGGRPAGTTVTSSEMAEIGRFSLPAVVSGTYTLEALDFASGRRAAQSVAVDASTGDPADLTLFLEPLGTVEGVVFEAADPPPHDCAGDSNLSGIRVTLGVHPDAGSPYPERTLAGSTGPGGRFVFRGVPGGRVSLEACSGAGVTGYAEADLAPGESVCVPVTLAETFTVSGRVLRAGGSGGGAPYAHVELDPAAAGRSYRATADAEGHFALSGVFPGDYVFAAWTGSGVNRTEQPLTVTSDTAVEQSLRGTGSVGGRVTNYSGSAGVPGARVSLHLADGEPFPLETQAGSDGAFFFPEAPAGEFRLEAAHAPSGRIGAADGLVLGEDQAMSGLEIPLEASFTLYGSVADESGAPVSGATLVWHAFRQDGTEVVRTAGTNSSGAFSISQIPLWPGTVTAEHPALGRCVQVESLTGVSDEDVQVRTLRLDRTPPTVDVSFVTGVPVEPGQPVPLDARLRLGFSEAMDTAWLAAHPGWAALVREQGGNWLTVNLAVDLQPDSRTVDLIPETLVDSSLYRLTVSGAVPDRNGNPLGADWVMTFRTVDLTAPGVAGFQPADGAVEVATGTEVLVVFSEPMDTNAGTVAWTHNGVLAPVSPAWSEGGTVLALAPEGGLAADGRYVVVLEGFRDLTGNALSGPASFTFDTLDTQPPVIDSGACGVEYSESRPVLSFPYSDALAAVDPASVHAELAGPAPDGGTLLPVEADGSRALFRLPEGLANGAWTLTVHAADTRGHAGSLACSFEYAHSEILVLDHDPAEGALAVGNPLPVAVRFWSARPLADAVLVLNGTALSGVPAMEGDHYLARVDCPVPSDGWVTVTAWATDDHGFTSAPAVFSFLADAYPPSLSLHCPHALTCDPTPPLSFESADAGAGVDPAASRVWIDGADRTAEFAIDAAGGAWLEASATPLNAGGHNLLVQVADLAGHVNQTEANFLVDHQPPSVNLYEPINGVGVTADTVEFQAYLGDNCALDPDTAAVFVNGQPWTGFQWNDGTLTGALAWDDPLLVLGDNAWTVRVRDALGNEGSATGTFRISRTVYLPFGRVDGNGYSYQVTPDCRLAWYGLMNGWAMLPSVTVWIGGAPYGLAPRTTGMVALDQQEIRTDGALDAESHRLEQRAFVPRDGYFARVQEWLTNTEAVGASATVEAAFLLPESFQWSVRATSSGDAVPDTADTWLVLDDALDQDDALGRNMPALGILFAGGYPARGPDAVELQPDRLVLRWVDLPLPPGTTDSPGRLGIAFAVSPQPTRESAIAAVERLAAGPAELFAGVPEDRWPQVANLDWSAGPDASQEPLPTLAGGISGTLRDATPDGHLIDYFTVLARNQSAVFRRARVSHIQGSGVFAVGKPDQSIGLPLGDVEILAGSEECGFLPAGIVTLTAPQPVVTGWESPVGGTGAVALTVRLSDGSPLPEGWAELESAAGCYVSAEIVNGMAVLAGVPEGTFTLTVLSDIGGTSVPVSAIAGVTVPMNLTLEQRVLSVRIIDALGNGMPGVTVHMCSDNSLVASPVTDAAGTAILRDPPGDTSLHILALHPDGRWAARRDLSVPMNGSLRLENVLLQPAGSIRARAESVAGQPLAGRTIRIDYSAYPYVPHLSAVTGANGEALFPFVPAGLALRWSVNDTAMYEFIVEAGQERLLLFTPAANFYTIQGVVRAADATTAVPYADVELQRQISAETYEYAAGTWCSAAGFYKFTNVKLPTGRARLVVRNPSSQGPGEQILLVALPVAGNVETPSSISLLAVEVRDGQGQLVSGADFLTIEPHDPDADFPRWAGADGLFKIFGARPGLAYDLSLGDGQGGFYCTTAVLPADQLVVSGITLVPCTARSIDGTLQAADLLTPVPDHPVFLLKEAATGEFYSGGSPSCTDATGYFGWTSLHLPTGRARLFVRLPDSQGGGEETLDVDLTQVGNLSVNFPASVTVVKGTVQDGAGGTVNLSGAIGLVPFEADWSVPPEGLRRLYQGAFTVFGLMPGREYAAYAYDWESGGAFGGSLAIPAGQGTLSGVVLAPYAYRWVEGTLRAADGQTVLPDSAEARLEKELTDGRYVHAGWAWRDSGGFFAVGGDFPTGCVRLLVPRPASQAGGEDAFPLVLPGDSPAEITTGWSVASGDVLDTAGRTVETAYGIQALPADPSLPPLPDGAMMTGGLWKIFGLASGQEYTLVAWDPRGGFYCAEIATGPGQLVLTGVRLEPCEPSFAEVRIRVQNAQGVPAAGIRLYLAIPGGSWAHATTDATGEAVFAGISTGAYEYGISDGEDSATGPLGFIYIHRGDTLEVVDAILPPSLDSIGTDCGGSGY